MFPWTDYNSGDLMWLGEWGTGSIFFLTLLGIGILSLSIYDLQPLPAYRRWTLVSLRGVVFGLAILILLEPALDLKNVTKVKNHVAVLVDHSRSMQLAADKSGTARAELVKKIADQLPTVEQEDHHFHLFSFGDALTKSTPNALRSSNFDLAESDLTGALGAIRETLGRVELGGIVIVSDGIDTGGIGTRVRPGEALDETSKMLLARLEVPINTVAVGRPEDLRDISITRVRHDDFAFVHNRVAIQAHVQSTGVDANVPVHLYRDSELLQTRTLSLTTDKSDHVVEFEFVPKRIGREVYRVHIPPIKDEILEENNEAFFVQKVIRDKIRVLQVVGRPSWDERFLRQLLKGNPNIDLISFFILRTAENVQVGSNDELSLIPFPTDELFSKELGSFDLVVFQNFDFGPYAMRQYLPEIANFVRRGGGFVMVGGDLSFASGGYAGTPIEDILPVKLPAVASRKLTDTNPFRPVLTEAGGRHPITQLAFDPMVNQEIWEKLPNQRGSNLVLEARDNATVLATHPKLKAGGKPMPVITVSEVDNGRVMAITTDSSWRWAFENAASGGTSREYQMFWNSTMRWLIKDPELKLLRIEFQQDRFKPGERVSLNVRVQSPDYTPAEGVRGQLEIRVEDLHTNTSKGEPKIVEFESDARGLATIELDADQIGTWKLMVRAETNAGSLVDEDLFIVVDSADELRQVLPRPDLLKSMADFTGGTHFQLPEFSRSNLNLVKSTTVQVNRRRVVSLWDSMLLFVSILILLSVEWTLRRRWGRL